MRLSNYEIKSIIETFRDIFSDGKIYLFGSRVDDNQKGGDIDLFLDIDDTSNLFEKKIEFLTKVQNKIGEQKIDVIFKIDNARTIEQDVNKQKVELDMEKIKLEKYFHECDKHIQRIEEAYEDLKDCIPLNAKSYINLDKEYVQAIDQYIFRFSKLQDTIGDKIFRLVFSFYGENYLSLPFLDILNKLEKLGYISNTKEWINLREIRNNIAHQYDDVPEEMSQAINTIVINKDVIFAIYKNLKAKYNLEIK